MDKRELLDQLVSYIKELINPQKVILFGSYAYGSPGEDSDIDLLIITEIEAQEQKRKLRAILRKNIPPMATGKDFIIVSPQEVERYKDIVGTVIYPALRNGRVLYERRD